MNGDCVDTLQEQVLVDFIHVVFPFSEDQHLNSPHQYYTNNILKENEALVLYETTMLCHKDRKEGPALFSHLRAVVLKFKGGVA